jgi:hypothetical protein
MRKRVPATTTIALSVLLAVLAGNSMASSAAVGPNVDFSKLPGIRHTKAPWSNASGSPPAMRKLTARLRSLRLQFGPHEGLRLHIHQHLDIFVNGRHVFVPALIGIGHAGNPPHLVSPPGFAALHTHDPSGILHVESLKLRAYSLGQFFAVWGVYLSKKCIGGYCARRGIPLRYYVNGRRFVGNPVRLRLVEHEEIAVVYGKRPGRIPSGYPWPPGI